MRRAAKKDSNQNAIVAILREEGCQVYDASGVGDGFPDLVVCRNGETALVEVKGPNGKLTKGQREFFGWWKGDKYVVTNELEARAVARTIGWQFGDEWPPFNEGEQA